MVGFYLFQGLSFHRTFQCQNLGLHFFHRTLIFNFNVEYSRMGFISGLETYHLICTQLYRTLPELYLGMIKHKYLSTDMYTICTVYSLIPFTIWAILRNDKSSIFNNTINQYIDFILISTTKGVFFSYCINKLLTYISTLYDIQLSVTYKKCCFVMLDFH